MECWTLKKCLVNCFEMIIFLKDLKSCKILRELYKHIPQIFTAFLDGLAESLFALTNFYKIRVRKDSD